MTATTNTTSPYPENTGWSILEPAVEMPSGDNDQLDLILTFTHPATEREMQMVYDFTLAGEVLILPTLERAEGTLDAFVSTVDETYDELLNEQPDRKDLRRNYWLYDSTVQIEISSHGTVHESMLDREESNLYTLDLEEHCAYKDLDIDRIKERLLVVGRSRAKQTLTFEDLEALWSKARGEETA